MISIGIDLGGTTIKIGLVSQGQILAQTEIAAHAADTFALVLPRIAAAVDELLVSKSLSKESLVGIGLAFPSVVDSVNMKILSRYVKYTDADSVDLSSWAQETWDIPLALENDARAALVGEWQYGAARNQAFAAMMTLGTGVGSAVLLEGRLLRGAHFVGGNLGGHMIINFQGDECNCGSRGCVETEGSSWVLPAKFGNDPRLATSSLAQSPILDFKAVFEGATAGDSFALEIRSHCLEAWAAGAINLVHAFDPEVLILGGGIMRSKDHIIPFIQHRIDTYTWLPPGSVKVVAAEQAQDAGVLGMAYLASQVAS